MSGKKVIELPAILEEKKQTKQELLKEAEEQYNSACALEFGNGVEKNMASAIHLYQLSASKGYPPAQYALGVCYLNGIGVAVNVQEAVRLFKLAAAQTYPESQYYLGFCHENGIGVRKDVQAAFHLYQLSANKGYAKAESAVGRAYLLGVGVVKDEQTGLGFYKRAAEHGYSKAQYQLGLYYWSGKFREFGVDKDVKEAHRLIKLAAEQGFQPAKVDLRKLFSDQNMPPQSAPKRLSGAMYKPSSAPQPTTALSEAFGLPDLREDYFSKLTIT